jgi:hypothetical protein
MGVWNRYPGGSARARVGRQGPSTPPAADWPWVSVPPRSRAGGGASVIDVDGPFGTGLGPGTEPWAVPRRARSAHPDGVGGCGFRLVSVPVPSGEDTWVGLRGQAGSHAHRPGWTSWWSGYRVRLWSGPWRCGGCRSCDCQRRTTLTGSRSKRPSCWASTPGSKPPSFSVARRHKCFSPHRSTMAARSMKSRPQPGRTAPGP